MTRVYLGIGSNIDPEAHLRLAVADLRRRFGDVRLSRVYRGPAIGFEGPDFLNLVVELATHRSPRRILKEIQAIHRLARRERDGEKFRSRTLDVDLLLYDGLIVSEPGVELPRPDVLEYAFVLRPLAELAPDFLHPLTGRPLREHWREFDAASQPLSPVEIDFGEAEVISPRYGRRQPQ